MTGSEIFTLFTDPNPLCLNCGGPLDVNREQQQVICRACGWPAIDPPDYVFGPAPVDVGRQLVVSVVPRTFGRASITASAPDTHTLGLYDESWDYASPLRAIYALVEWVGTPHASEPEGWERHKPSHRRRPNGDPAHEYVSP